MLSNLAAHIATATSTAQRQFESIKAKADQLKDFSVSDYELKLVQDYFTASRDQTRNLQGCGAGTSPNPFARPKGMGEHHMLPMESNVAYARFQMAADYVDPHDDASCPSTALKIETMPQQGRFTARDDDLLSTPKDQQCRGIFNWIQGLFSCFSSQDPLSATQATNYGTIPAVTSTDLSVGGEFDGNANGMIAAAVGKRKYLHWLCDGSDFN
ncbi:hypothetical protein HDU77_006522 [Chytriomyces hyalinus]|nr:hypothetical protein HDU77_006522 [Chytriomyces hyalinus]